MQQLRHSFTTRLLLTCISAKLYHNDQTTDDLFAAITRQAHDLALDGVTAPLVN